MTTAEQERPVADSRGWPRWGPYLAERACHQTGRTGLVADLLLRKD